jgi:hypothetical protein
MKNTKKTTQSNNNDLFTLPSITTIESIGNLVVDEKTNELTITEKLKAMFESEIIEAQAVLTGTFVSQKTIYNPVYSLVTSTANKIEPIAKEIKGKERTIKAKERNKRILTDLENGVFLDDSIVLKRFRENLQKLLPLNFGLVFDLPNTETAEIIKFACSQVTKHFEQATTRDKSFKMTREFYRDAVKAEKAS